MHKIDKKGRGIFAPILSSILKKKVKFDQKSLQRGDLKKMKNSDGYQLLQ